ncbi:MAG: 50S ribosomal protein L29 [Candidatus Taylorbacteria bacterium]
MKMKEITTKTTSDLSRLMAEKKEALRAFRFGSAGAKTKNVKEGRGLRKDIARIMTQIASVKGKK